MHSRIWRSWLAAFAVAQASVVAATFHVAKNGRDDQPGTARQPFATFERARDAVRARRATHPEGEAMAVMIHGGRYRLTQELVLDERDSGTAAHPVLWQAAPGAAVVLTGGPDLSATDLKAVTDPRVLERLDPAARPHVREVELRALGVTGLAPFPDRFRGAPAMPELFFDGARMTLARWPNEGWATVARIVDSGSVPREGEKPDRPGAFEFSGDRPGRWQPAAGVWLQGYWCFDWYEETIRVAAIDPASRRVTFSQPSMYGVKQGNPSPRRYRALNLLEELDQPGEFQLDPAQGRLFFWPPTDPARARVTLSTLTTPLLRLTNASHVTLCGLTFEAGLANGLEVTDGRSNLIAGCTIRNMRQLGLQVRGGHGHRVVDCAVHDTGTGGLWVEGGDRRALVAAGHEVENNHVWQFSRHQFTSAYGLTLGGVGNRAAHNFIHDAPHQAVALPGNDLVFEYNVVSNVVTETDDAGALYKGRNPSCRGNLIRYNLWQAIGNPMGHGTAAIYFDDGDGGDTVFGNLFVRCGHPGKGSFGTVFSHGGHDIRAENNVFVDCPRALGSAPWGDQLWKATIDGGNDCNWIKLLREEVDVSRPPYTTRYPELVGFLTPSPDRPRVSRARNNVFIRCGEISSGNWKYDQADQLVLAVDPGFVEAATGRVPLRPEAEVYRRLPGFVPIPFDHIGLRPRGR